VKEATSGGSRRIRGITILPLAGIGLLACSGENLVLPSGGAPHTMAVERGDKQAGPAGEPLPDSVVVRVTDTLARPVERAVVAFTPFDGGIVRPDTLRTDADGRAGTRWTLGDTPGPQRLRAQVVGSGLEVLIQATARAGGPPPAGMIPTSTVIVSHTPDPSDQGRGVAVTVAVTTQQGGSTPPGDFDVRASTGEICSGVTSQGTAECIFNTPGQRTLTATYAGADQYAASTSAAVTHTVRAVAGATETVIGTAPDPAAVGDVVRLFVTVHGAGNTPAFGIVNFYADTVRTPGACGKGPLIASVTLDARGQGDVGARFAAPGVWFIRGCYLGAPGFAPSEDLANETIR
jgi:Big-like domain-containing protein